MITAVDVVCSCRM